MKNLILLFALIAATAMAQTDGKEWAFQGQLDKMLSQLPEGTVHEHAMVEMSDGTKLATEVFMPPGDGPWPVVLVRTPYPRFPYAGRVAGKDVVYVTQNTRGRFESEKGSDDNALSSLNEIQDGYDCIEWINEQPWSNGQVGMFGGSGNGFCAEMAYFSKAPGLRVVNPYVGNTELHWGFENGVRRWLYKWLNNRNLNVSEWPKPTLPQNYNPDEWKKELADYVKDNDTIYIGYCGYYDICLDAALDAYEASGGEAPIYVKTSSNAHTGPQKIFPWPKQAPEAGQWPDFFSTLNGEEPQVEPGVCYTIMGDINDPSAPGHEVRYTREWPPPHEEVSFYLQPDLSLDGKPSSDSDAICEYDYDPRNPIPTVGGHHFYSQQPAGALDQRELSGRTNDILRFVSAPLEDPLTVVGKLRAELFISTDVPDTVFIVKLVDIYPDGMEMLIRETAFLARYANGWENPEPLEEGEVYKLDIDMRSTGIAFDKGHRIAVFVQSSSTPAYEVHPNSYEPVMSYDNSPVAHQQIHTSKKYPSRIILPVIE